MNYLRRWKEKLSFRLRRRNNMRRCVRWMENLLLRLRNYMRRGVRWMENLPLHHCNQSVAEGGFTSSECEAVTVSIQYTIIISPLLCGLYFHLSCFHCTLVVRTLPMIFTSPIYGTIQPCFFRGGSRYQVGKRRLGLPRGPTATQASSAVNLVIF